MINFVWIVSLNNEILSVHVTETEALNKVEWHQKIFYEDYYWDTSTSICDDLGYSWSCNKIEYKLVGKAIT